MLLSQIFIDYKNKIELLKNYTLVYKFVSNTHSHIIFENEENIITLDIEENEGYVSILFERKTNQMIYYALSDYSYLKGAKNVFDVLSNSDEKDLFYQEVNNCVKNQKKIGKRNIYQIKLVKLIYELIEKFIKM